MQDKKDYGISPVIGTILLVAIVVILIIVVAVAVFGLGGVSGGKVVGVMPQNTGNPASPMQLMLWGSNQDLSSMKGVRVAVATPTGTKIGLPGNNQVSFVQGIPVTIEFSEGFSEGEYPVTVTGTFTDGTEQMIYTGRMQIGATGSVPQEVSDRARLAINCEAVDGSNGNVKVTDKSVYNPEYPIQKWILDYGDGTGPEEYSIATYPDKGIFPRHTYALGDLSEKTYAVTFTVHYADNTKTSITEKVVAYNNIKENSLKKYLDVFKIEDKRTSPVTMIDLRFVNAVTIWKEGLSDRGLQITISGKKSGVDGWYFSDDKGNQTDTKGNVNILSDAKPGDVRSITVKPYNSSTGVLMTHTVTITVR